MHRKLILFIVVALVVGSFAGCLRTKTSKLGPAALTFYGLDDSDIWEPLIAAYRQENSSVTIKYKKFNNPAEYENLLVDEIAEGEGPDVFYIHNTWLPRHTKKLLPLLSEVLTPKTLSETFVGVVAQDFIQPDPADGNQKIYALPLYVDTLALYYNKKLFEQKLPERGKPAESWELLKDDAAKFRNESAEGILENGAIALGRGDNIKLASDILYNLFLQAGVQFYDSEFKHVSFARDAKETFEYFLSFSGAQNKNYSWNADLVTPGGELSEVEAFLAGKVAMILGYSDLYPRLENELKNVKALNLSVIGKDDISVARVPQIATDESDYRVFANYYGLGVSRNSKYSPAAWDFIRFAASKERARFYHQKTKRPTARRDLIEEQKKEPVTDVFVSQVGYAGSFRIFSDQRFADFLKQAVQAAVNGQSSSSALSAAEQSMNDILKIEAPEGLYPKPKKK